MADIALQPRMAKPQIREATAWDQLKTNRNWLGFWFMLPAMAFLIFFLAYPLGLGIWISFTDARIGRPGEFIGIEGKARELLLVERPCPAVADTRVRAMAPPPERATACGALRVLTEEAGPAALMALAIVV